MNRKEKVMKRLQEHYDYLIEQGHEVVFLVHQGSYNYNLDYEKSDIDSKAIILPSFEDFVQSKAPFSYTYILDNEEHIDTKDVRKMCELWQKENISYIELLYSDFIIINPKYKDLVDELIMHRDDIVNINKDQFLRCIVGMSREKVKALCHPYPNLIEKIKKYGFDGKQLSHCARLNEFIKRYTINKEPIKDCYISKIPEILINFKQNLNITGTDYLPLEEAIRLCNIYDKNTYDIEQSYLGNPINEENLVYLNDFKYKTLERFFKNTLKTLDI